MAINYWHNFNEGSVYHIYHRAAFQGLNLFNEESDYINFIEKYDHYFSPYFDTFAFCLMPNHFHFLSKVKPLTEVEKFIQKEKTKSALRVLEEQLPINHFLVDQMRRLLSSVSISFNNKYSRRGPLFSERFKRVSVESEPKLQYLLCYIHHNPIHHNFSKTYIDWNHSSYHDYLSNNNTLIKIEEILDWVGGLDFFIKIHEDFKIIKNDYLNFD